MTSRKYVRRYIYLSVTIGIILLTILTVLFVTGIHSNNITASSRGSSAFVTRSGSTLLLDGKTFRFSGANIYWLGLQEITGGVTYPSHFEVDDALGTAEFMGATVVRSHTLGISVGCSLCIEPSLGRFNQVGLQHIDYAIQSARIHHIRLIIPLVDNWHYYHGGKHTFTDWRGIDDESRFYSNPLVISDFKHYVSVILNHVNSYSGIAYKNDPTILAWELGNELSAPNEWVRTMADYLKSNDPHHLVMDGNYEQANDSGNFLQDLRVGTLDLYSSHYYPPTIAAFQLQVHQASSAGKVFIVGEYDWNTNEGTSLRDFLGAVEYSKASGDLYWTLFPHGDEYGYVQHNQHYTLHYPGDTLDMRRRVRLLVAHAFAMRSIPVPTKAVVGTPFITSVSGNAIAWRGAIGADTYTVERSTISAGGPWTTVCSRCATDDDTPWVDPSMPSGIIWYRVKGYSTYGYPGAYSNVYQSEG